MPPLRLAPFEQGKKAMEEFVDTTSYLDEEGNLDDEELPVVDDPEGDEDSR